MQSSTVLLPTPPRLPLPFSPPTLLFLIQLPRPLRPTHHLPSAPTTDTETTKSFDIHCVPFFVLHRGYDAFTLSRPIKCPPGLTWSTPACTWSTTRRFFQMPTIFPLLAVLQLKAIYIEYRVCPKDLSTSTTTSCWEHLLGRKIFIRLRRVKKCTSRGMYPNAVSVVPMDGLEIVSVIWPATIPNVCGI